MRQRDHADLQFGRMGKITGHRSCQIGSAREACRIGDHSPALLEARALPRFFAFLSMHPDRQANRRLNELSHKKCGLL
jgi:hypothetical protein